MKKMIAFLLLLAAPLMAQHATQFAYYTTNTCQIISFPFEKSNGFQESAPPINPYNAIAWDPDTQISTEGISLESNYGSPVTLCKQQTMLQGLEFPNTILIHHAGWYLAKFLVTGEQSNRVDGIMFTLRFGLLNLDESTIIPFSVYGLESEPGETEQLAGQVVFYVPANTHIQLVNDGEEETTVNPLDNSVTSLYLFELLGR